jgi:hypothetical protein
MKYVILLRNTSQSAATINFRNDTRAPLLFVAGGKDRVVPNSLVKANFELYRESKAETITKSFTIERIS